MLNLTVNKEIKTEDIQQEKAKIRSYLSSYLQDQRIFLKDVDGVTTFQRQPMQSTDSNNNIYSNAKLYSSGKIIFKESNGILVLEVIVEIWDLFLISLFVSSIITGLILILSNLKVLIGICVGLSTLSFLLIIGSILIKKEISRLVEWSCV